MTIERQDILEDFYVGVHKNIRDTIYDSDGNLFDLTDGEVNFYMFDELTGEVYITKTSAYADEVLITDAANGDYTPGTTAQLTAGFPEFTVDSTAHHI